MLFNYLCNNVVSITCINNARSFQHLPLTLKSQKSSLVLSARNTCNLVFNCNRDDRLNVNIRSVELVLSPL